MKYMNDMDMEFVLRDPRTNEVQRKAARFLLRFKDKIDSMSDGWAYWNPPVRAAKKMMELCDRGAAPTEADYKRALTPIKSFCTKRGVAFEL